MQPVIERLQSLLANELGLVLGYVIVTLVLAQLTLQAFNTLRRTLNHRRQMALTRERLYYQVRAAALQYREAEQIKLFWNGYRKFQVSRKIKECADVYSFYLTPHDRKPIPAFKPGQYLTFQLDIPGRNKPVIRCYSLSDCHRPDYYRVTIKKAEPPPDCPDAPAGIASSYFCDSLKEGDILDVKAPSGNFVLEVQRQIPVVLISGGVGITPMISMLNAIVQSGTKREVWFFFGARNSMDHIQKDYLEQVAAQHSNVRLQICYSKPGPRDVKGRDYHHAERVSVDLFKRLLPSNNYEYYLCGPGAFMKSITDGLKEWGVPDNAVFYEAFGPATVKKAAAPAAAPTPGAGTIQISFSRSGKVCTWKGGNGTLLDLAEEQGIAIESGCRAGNCGTCLVAIKSGEVSYMSGHGATGEDGSCLTCICQPKSDLVLDA